MSDTKNVVVNEDGEFVVSFADGSWNVDVEQVANNKIVISASKDKLAVTAERKPSLIREKIVQYNQTIMEKKAWKKQQQEDTKLAVEVLEHIADLCAVGDPPNLEEYTDVLKLDEAAVMYWNAAQANLSNYKKSCTFEYIAYRLKELGRCRVDVGDLKTGIRPPGITYNIMHGEEDESGGELTVTNAAMDAAKRIYWRKRHNSPALTAAKTPQPKNPKASFTVDTRKSGVPVEQKQKSAYIPESKEHKHDRAGIKGADKMNELLNKWDRQGII